MCVCPTIAIYIEDETGKTFVKFSPKYKPLKEISQLDNNFNYILFDQVRDKYKGHFVNDIEIKEKYFVRDFLLIPCGKCVECLKARSLNNTARVFLNVLSLKDRMSFNDFSNSCYFVTLTYSDLFLPKNYSLSKRDLQLFLKRLRKYFDYNFGKNLFHFKYYACGEYGDKTLRPHYHLLLMFEISCSEKILKDALKNTWSFGLIDYKNTSDLSAISYITRYCDKKIEFSLRDVYSKDYISPFCLSSKNLGYSYFLDHFDYYLQLGYIPGPDGFNLPLPSIYLRRLKDDFLVKDLKEKDRIKSFDTIRSKLNQYQMIGGSFLTNQLNRNDVMKSKKRKLRRDKI